MTTGILPPEIGGPANYVASLSRELRDMGHSVTAISYGKSNEIRGVRTVGIKRRSNRLINLVIFFRQVLKLGRSADIIMTFDLMSAGLPTLLANLFLKREIILRLGGDFFWERDLNDDLVFCTLEDYYRKRLYRRGSAFLIARFMIKRLGLLVCSTSFLEGLYLKAFPALRGKTTVIQNPYPDVKKRIYFNSGIQEDNGRRKFIFVGRLIKLKNLKALLDIFFDMKNDNPEACLEIYGDGPERETLNHMVESMGLEGIVKIFPPLPQEEIMEKIGSSYACILPSLSEVSPNFGLECLKLNKPLIITRFNGLQEIFRYYAVQVDPFNPGEIKKRILEFINAKSYQDLTPNIGDGQLTRTWRDVAKETLRVMKTLNPHDSSPEIVC